MTLSLSSLMVVLSLGCGSDSVNSTTTASTTTTTTSAATVTTATSTVTGTDADGDGWTIQAGDCDDDNVWVNPGWPEELGDGIDNDCDGRVDEKFVGVAVFEYDSADGSSWVHTIDTMGDKQSSLALSEAACPVWLEDDFDGDGWIYNDGAALYSLSSDGVVTLLLDLTKMKLPKGIGEYGIYGLGVHPDGYYLLSAVNALIKVETNGSWDVLVEWPIDLKKGKDHTIAPLDLAVDRYNGRIGLGGYWGGFATIVDGVFNEVVNDDLPYGGPPIYDMHFGDAGGFYAMGQDPKIGVYGVYRFNETNNEWTEKVAWVNDSYTPFGLAVEAESGDFYLSANGGWYRQVWRYYADGSGGAILYETEPDSDSKMFCGLSVLWEEGG